MGVARFWLKYFLNGGFLNPISSYFHSFIFCAIYIYCFVYLGHEMVYRVALYRFPLNPFFFRVGHRFQFSQKCLVFFLGGVGAQSSLSQAFQRKKKAASPPRQCASQPLPSRRGLSTKGLPGVVGCCMRFAIRLLVFNTC